MTYANPKRRDLVGRATFFCLVKLPVRGVTRPPFPLLTKIRGLTHETNNVIGHVHRVNIADK